MSTHPAGRRPVITVDGTRTAPARPSRFGPAGAFAAVQAAVFSYLLVLLPAIVSFVASSTGSDQGWGQSVTIANGLWLLGHGVPMAAGSVTITLVPLGLTCLDVFCCYVTARHSARPTVTSWATATVTYAVIVAAVALFGDTSGIALIIAPLAGLAVGGIGFAAGVLSRPDAPFLDELTSRLDRFLPPAARLGMRGAMVAFASVVALAAILAECWLLAGRATSADILTSLNPGAIGGIVFAVAQLLALPNLVLWCSAWMVGPGFAVGSNSTFTPSGSTAGLLPAIPLLGGLPEAGWHGGLWVAVPIVIVGIGVLAGVFVWRRLGEIASLDDAGRPAWPSIAWAFGALVVTSGLAMGIVQAWSGGAIGPGTMRDVGANALATGGLFGLEIGVGAAAVLAWERFVRRGATA